MEASFSKTFSKMAQESLTLGREECNNYDVM
jgi:hypothetical protein